MDGGTNIQYHLGLSGETRAEQIIVGQSGIQFNASEIAALNVAKREYQKRYMDYWNSTADITGTGRPVDGVFCPVAPHASAIPGHYRVLGYTTFVNVLDYTSVVIPVTFADKAVDVRGADPSFSGSEDWIEWDCECARLALLPGFADRSIDDAETYHGAPVGLQLMGRRLQEEKMLTLAEYLGEEIARGVGRK